MSNGSPTQPPTVPNVFSCDVEDWHQLYFRTDVVSERCYVNTVKCLEILADHDVTGTFFVQGLVADQRPEVVRAILDGGHEIQSHGYDHRLTWHLGPDGFRDDLQRSIDVLTNISGQPITGFRAPCFSIGRSEWWAFDVMAELGLTYDSSIFPMPMRRYGMYFEPGYSVIRCETGESAEIEELPISVLGSGRVRVPVGGGGYLRLLPGAMLAGAVRRMNAAGRPFVLYCHPYEFDPEEFRKMSAQVPLLRRIHQQMFRSSVPRKMSMMFRAGRFTTLADALAHERERRIGEPS